MAARKDGRSRAEEFAVTPIDAHIGGRIRLLRVRVGLPAHALATQIGVTRQAVEKYEKGQQRIPAARLYEIAVALDATPGWFFEGSDHLLIPDGRPEPGQHATTAAGEDVLVRFERLTPEQRRAVSLVVTAFDEGNASQGSAGK